MTAIGIALNKVSRVPIRRPRRFDVVVAAAVAAIGQQGVWAPGPGFAHPVGPRPALAISLLLASAALLWRREAPLLVVAIVNLVLGLQFMAFGAPDGLGNFLPPLLAFYAAGRYGSRATFAAALVITAAGLAAHELRDPLFSFEGRTLVMWAILFGGGIMGVVFKARARQLGDMTRHAEQLVSIGEKQAEAAAVQERQRIARELHDLVGHGVSLVVLQAVAAQGSLEKGDVDTTRERLDRLEATARATLAEMRRLVSVSGESDAMLAPQPSLADLDELVARVRADGVDVEFERPSEQIELGNGLSLAVYRLVQEALTNVIKHARPAAARVGVALEGDRLTVEVVDSGRQPARGLGGGRGLAGMRERVALYGGTLQVGPRPEGGFGVRASFPLDGSPG